MREFKVSFSKKYLLLLIPAIVLHIMSVFAAPAIAPLLIITAMVLYVAVPFIGTKQTVVISQ